MYKIIDFIKEVKSFFVVNNKLYYLNNGGFLILNNEILFKSYGIEKKLDTIFCYQNLDDVNTIILKSSGEVIKTSYSLDSNSYNEINTIIHNKDYKLLNQQIGLYNIEMDNIRWFDNILPFGLNIRNYDSLYYRQSTTKVVSLSLLTGLYEWEVPLNRNGEIFKVLGVRENELVVCFKQGLDYYGLLGIDIETGKIMWNIDDNFLLNGLNMYFTPNQASIFSTKGEGRNSYFIELDLTTKQATRYGEIVDLCKEQLAISTSFLKDDLVYFTAGNHTFFPNTIGVFDYKTLKLLWKYTFSFDKNTHLKDMQVSENKLYVLDSGGTLHIFEKENEYNEII